MGVPGDGIGRMKYAAKARAEQMSLEARRYTSRRSMVFLPSS
jgi:hypothetical protein